MRIGATSPTPVRLMTIGQLARKSGLTPRAIRYYEQLGLVQPPLRTDSNYRLFDSDSVERLHFISKCRSLGFSIAQITDVLSITDNSADTCVEVGELAKHHLILIDGKLHDLMRMRISLAKSTAGCGLDVPICPVLELLKKSG